MKNKLQITLLIILLLINSKIYASPLKDNINLSCNKNIIIPNILNFFLGRENNLVSSFKLKTNKNNEIDLYTKTIDNKKSINQNNILNNIKYLTTEPRLVGSKREKEIANHYKKIFNSYGYKVKLQEFPFKNLSIDEVLKINKNKIIEYNYDHIDGTGTNIIATKPADTNKAREILIISAHYDSESINNGVIDNATGVAALVELSRLLQDIPLDIEIRFILFSGEENFMSGSRHYVSELENDEISKVININIDSIGEVGELYPIIGTIDSKENRVSNLFSFYTSNNLTEIKKGPPSDYLAFHYINRPSITIAQYPSKLLSNIDGLINEDKIERVDLLKIEKIVDMIYEVIINNYLNTKTKGDGRLYE